MHRLTTFTPTEKFVAIVGNGMSWMFAFVAAQDFAFWCAGAASLATALFMVTKWVFTIVDRNKE